MYLLASALLLWPLLLNGGPLYFYDTAAYLRYPALAFQKLLGVESDLSAALLGTGTDPEAPPATGSPGAVPGPSAGLPAGPGPAAADTVAAGRSIYYGAMLYAGALVGGIWVGVLLQLGCVALAVYLTLAALLGLGRRRLYPAVMALLAVATPLPFFVCYLMPDVFAGIALLAIANLFAFERGLASWQRLLWLGLLALALLFHSSHTATALLLLVPATAVAWVLLRRPPWRAAATIAVAAGLGLLGEAAFTRTVDAVYGAPPVRPPFLMARVASDAPGAAWLAAHCPEVGLRLCAFAPRLPLDTDLFLWSKDPAVGVYGSADAATRRALDAEQATFVLGVLAADPLGQLAASLGDFGTQFARFGLGEFAYEDYMRETVAAILPPGTRAAFVGSALYRGTFPLDAADLLARAATAAAAGWLAWHAAAGLVDRSRKGTRPADPAQADRALLVFTIILVGGVVANAAVTGILSTPHDRYQARVIWLVPLLALIVFLRGRPAAADSKEFPVS